MNGACLFLGILFLAAGIYFYSGKAVNHIAAWKTMPEEEKRKIHIRPLCRNVGMMIATSGIIFYSAEHGTRFVKAGFYGVWSAGWSYPARMCTGSENPAGSRVQENSRQRSLR